MTSRLDLGPPTDQLVALLAAITDEQLDGPTPCDTTVAGLLSHVGGLAQAFTGAAHKTNGPDDGQASVDPAGLDPAWRTLIPEQLAALAAAWREPAAWEGTAWAGGFEAPGEVMAAIANDEVVLHGWDLARSTGQPFEVAPANLEACHAFVAESKDDPAAREGLFGPPVPVADDAPFLDRTVALAGRDPAWSPASA